MNNKIAISLIFGFKFSIIISFGLSENKYYDLYKERKEITYERFNSLDSLYKVKEKKINSSLIYICLLGGFGIGYLFSDRIEKKIKLFKLNRNFLSLKN